MKRKIFNKKNLNDSERKVWNVLLLIVFGGILLLALLSSYDIYDGQTTKADVLNILASFGTVSLVAGACYCGGIFLGFIFGIPKIIQNPLSVPDKYKKKETCAYNDNLAQISDWLTKILVGVGLTQLTKIPAFLNKIGVFLSYSFPGHYRLNANDFGLARNGSIATVLYFSIAGFLTAYLWTSIFFTKMLSGEEENNDPQKGKWGEEAEANGRKITAVFGNKDKTAGVYPVTISIDSIDAQKNPLTGVAIFYMPLDISGGVQSVVVVNGKAELKLKIEHVFTIGAECDNCETKLELDLRDVIGVPADILD